MTRPCCGHPAGGALAVLACCAWLACGDREYQFDFDQDGWDDENDCVPDDALVHPGQGEIVCDGVDNDCDAQTPDNPDGDGDGVGICDDCNDAFDGNFPGNEESCDGLDNDCDGAPDASELDVDGDGYAACQGDCDDDDPLVNPDAIEICNDGIDANCDGQHNGCVMSLGQADERFAGQNPGDQAGAYLAAVGDATGDGTADLLVGAPYNDQAGYNAGAAYLIAGEGATSGNLADAHGRYRGEGSYDYAGRVAGAGDVNGDGQPDVLVAALGAADMRGRVYLFHGPLAAGNASVGAADAVLQGENADDVAGYAIAGLGDLDGDGFGEVLVGAPQADTDIASEGAAYLVYGPLAGGTSLATAESVLWGDSESHFVGVAVAPAGDTNGDGQTEFIIGAYGESSGGNRSGAAYLFRTPPPLGSQSISTADVVFLGEAAEDYAGLRAAAAGDVNGNGRGELLICAPYNDEGGPDAGAAYLLSAPFDATVPLADADAKLVGEAANHTVMSAAAAGDVNDDGFDDVLVGSPHATEGGSSAGTAYLMLGPFEGTISLTDADARFLGEAPYGEAHEVAGMGDVNDDGYDDFAVGAPLYSEAGPDAGAVYLIYGGGI